MTSLNVLTLKFRRIDLILILFLIQYPLFGQGLPIASPETVGLSSERLSCFGSVMNDSFGKGKIPGIVTLVLRPGKVVYFKTFGTMDIEAGNFESNMHDYRCSFYLYDQNLEIKKTITKILMKEKN